MKQEMVGSVPGNVLGMIADLAHKLQHGVLTPTELGLFLKRQNPFDNNDVEGYRTLYLTYFGLDLDFSSVRIPEPRPGFTRTLIVPQGMTPNHAYEACQKHFPCWKYTSDLDSALDWDKEERNPKDAPYAILVKDTQAADDNLKNLSAIQIKEKGITTETLTERLLHELMYWSETKKHLDPNTITLCSGSRSRGGHVPHVSWGGDDMRVRWCSHDDSSSRLRSREVVF